MSTAPGRPQAAGWRQRVERVGAGVRGGLNQLHSGIVYVGRVLGLLLAFVLSPLAPLPKGQPLRRK